MNMSKTKMYKPPFDITSEMLRLISEISEQVGIINMRLGENAPSPHLRKKSQIMTIHSSLAIEQNSLSLKQVTDIIDGKRVLGAPDEIQEVKNAIEAYRLMPELDAFKEKDLQKAHGLMMKDLVKQAGHYRQEGVGVFDGNGNKERVKEIFERCMTDVDLTIYDKEELTNKDMYWKTKAKYNKLKTNREEYYKLIKKSVAISKKIKEMNGRRGFIFDYED